MGQKCVLCNSNKVNILQKLKNDELISLYFNEFEIDITKDLKDIDKKSFYSCQNCKLYYFDSFSAGGEQFYESLLHIQ